MVVIQQLRRPFKCRQRMIHQGYPRTDLNKACRRQ